MYNIKTLYTISLYQQNAQRRIRFPHSERIILRDPVLNTEDRVLLHLQWRAALKRAPLYAICHIKQKQEHEQAHVKCQGARHSSNPGSEIPFRNSEPCALVLMSREPWAAGAGLSGLPQLQLQLQLPAPSSQLPASRTRTQNENENENENEGRGAAEKNK
jgi:hypothetical protein